MLVSNTKKESCFSRDNTPSCHVRPSFREAFCRAAKQVSLNECTDILKQALLRELCYIMAEVYLMEPDFKMKISDVVLVASLIQEVFEKLTLNHLILVADNFRNQTEVIKDKRAYLRTSLYNSIFEYEAYYANIVNSEEVNT